VDKGGVVLEGWAIERLKDHEILEKVGCVQVGYSLFRTLSERFYVDYNCTLSFFIN
jgi:hypothetical protein